MRWTERNVRPFGWEDEWATSLFTFLIGPNFLADCFACFREREREREVGSLHSRFQPAAASGPATHDRVKKVPELVIRVVVLLLVAAAANAVDAAVGPSNATEKCGQNPL